MAQIPEAFVLASDAMKAYVEKRGVPFSLVASELPSLSAGQWLHLGPFQMRVSEYGGQLVIDRDAFDEVMAFLERHPD